MSPLWLPLIGLVAFYELWIYFLCVMSLKRAKKAGLLSKTAIFFGTPILLTGYLLDAFVNVFVLTLVLLELPEELTVTARLKRHIRESHDWRLSVAKWFVPLLDPFDPSGRHISEE